MACGCHHGSWRLVQQQQAPSLLQARRAACGAVARPATAAAAPRSSGLAARAVGGRQPQQQPPPQQPQQTHDLDALRQQGGYGYAPPRGQPQQQGWQWDAATQQQAQQQQQQQAAGPWGGPATQPGAAGGGPGGGGGGSGGGGSDGGGLSGYTKALIAAAFVTGLGAGVYFDAEINLSPNQVASTEIIDRRTPNAEVCMAYGYSAMVFDQRVFVTYNPFNLYVTQPEVKPGCILRRSNFAVLEREQLVDGKQVEACKKRMNTFGFVGDLSKEPEVSCVYHSEEAENQYLLNPEKALQLGEGEGKPGGAGAAPN